MTHLPFVRDALERYEGRLLLYARRLLGDEERARDVVQETFLKLCRQRRADVERRLAEWLYTVVRNGAIDARRRERVMKVSDEVRVDERVDPAGGGPGARLEREEEGARVLASLASLPEKEQEALRLKFQGGLSYREIAGVTGESIGTVGWRIHEGLKTLRARLGAGETSEGRVTS